MEKQVDTAPFMSIFPPQINKHHPAEAELTTWLLAYAKSNGSNNKRTISQDNRKRVRRWVFKAIDMYIIWRILAFIIEYA